MTIKVKPLVWRDVGDGVTRIADSIFGLWSHWEDHYSSPFTHGGLRADNPPAAAQADYEARILSAIDKEQDQ